MERKSIGSFITALRKANGMTQKDLADRLNVSDKTVSRWERDEGTPDLSLIPVLAEIFDVTCDELLRGERKSPDERTEDIAASASPRGEKQKQRLLKSALAGYRSQNYIAVGISTVGLLVALICNFAFLRASLGFFMGAVFFTASVIWLFVSLNRAFLSVEDGELSEDALAFFRRDIISLTERSLAVTVALIGFTLPLLPVDAYLGLTIDSMLLYGLIGAVCLLAVYAVICYFLNASFLKKGTYMLPEAAFTVYQHNHRLQGTCAVILAVVVAVTALAHAGMTQISLIMKGREFTDYESFVAFMEQDIPEEAIYNPSDDSYSVPIDLDETEDDGIWYDEYGNEITKEEAFHHTFKDANGKVVCEFTQRNMQVISWRYHAQNGTVLPIHVFTQADLAAANDLANTRHLVFGFLYGVEALIVLLVYMMKRKTVK